MKGRTYRYYDGEVEYPFGYGMSYPSFDYTWNKKPFINKDTISFSVKVKNTGKYNGDEVAQAYVQYPQQPAMPLN